MGQFQRPPQQPPHIGTKPDMPATPPPQQPWYPPSGYYPPPQGYQPPFPPQGYLPGPMPSPYAQFRPVRQNIKLASIVCFVAASLLIYLGGIQYLALVELLNFAGFILIFFI